MFAAALRDSTAPAELLGAGWLGGGELLCLLSALSAVSLPAAGGLTPAKSAPMISVTGPGLPVGGAGSASVFWPAGTALSAVMTV